MHQSQVRGFLFRLCQDYDQADDLAQDTFLKAFRKLDSYKASGKFASWLFGIAYRVFLESDRSDRRRSEITTRLADETLIEPQRYNGLSAEQLDLERAILTLNETEAATISLCYSYGCSHSEAAEALGLPLGTVKTSVRRAKQKLVAAMRPTENEAQLGEGTADDNHSQLVRKHKAGSA